MRIHRLLHKVLNHYYRTESAKEYQEHIMHLKEIPVQKIEIKPIAKTNEFLKSNLLNDAYFLHKKPIRKYL